MPYPAVLRPCLSEFFPRRVQFWFLSRWSFVVKFNCHPSPCTCEERTRTNVWQIVALTTPHYRILPRAFVNYRLPTYFVPTKSLYFLWLLSKTSFLCGSQFWTATALLFNPYVSNHTPVTTRALCRICQQHWDFSHFRVSNFICNLNLSTLLFIYVCDVRSMNSYSP
jgi:hypothetical protein